MSGNLEHGENIRIDTERNTISIGDLVVFRSGGHQLIKRVVGIPGSPISQNELTLTVNGETIQLQNEAQVHCWKDWIGNNTTIPDKCIFVLGTILASSIDSRRLGWILFEDIIGIGFKDS